MYCMWLRQLLPGAKFMSVVFDGHCQLRVVVELVWPLVLFLILMWVKMDNTDLREYVHECMLCVLCVFFISATMNIVNIGGD